MEQKLLAVEIEAEQPPMATSAAEADAFYEEALRELAAGLGLSLEQIRAAHEEWSSHSPIQVRKGQVLLYVS